MYQYATKNQTFSEENSLLSLDKTPRKTLNLHRKGQIQKTKNMALVQRPIHHVNYNREERSRARSQKRVSAPLNKQFLQHKTCLRGIIWGWSMHRVLELLHLKLTRVENKSRSQLLERSGATYSFTSFFLYDKFLWSASFQSKCNRLRQCKGSTMSLRM